MFLDERTSGDLKCFSRMYVSISQDLHVTDLTKYMSYINISLIDYDII